MAKPEPYDVLGAVMCAATFGLIIGGMESAVHGNSPVVSGAIVAAGVAVAWIFVRRERGEAEPILPVDLLARPVLALSTIGAITAFTASMTAIISLPFRLEQGFGFDPSAIGAMIVPWPLTVMVVGPVAGTLSDKVPAGLLGGIGMAIAVVALLLLGFLPAHPAWFDVAWRMSLAGVGFGLFLSPNARLVLGSAPPGRTASVGGLIATARMTGQTLGATVVALLLAMGFGSGSAAPLVAAALAGVAGICSIARLRPEYRNPSPSEVPRATPYTAQGAGGASPD